MIEIDGSQGEGGGQILRSSLTLALLTGRAFTLRRIRANRDKPGLRPQHLTCVLAAARIGSARVEGASVNSTELTFEPGPVSPGQYHFDTGTAGSTALILQTVLLPLALAPPSGDATRTGSTVQVTGGTHNDHAPSIDYVARVFLPAIAPTGLRASCELLRHGFYPRGGGTARLSVEPAPHFFDHATGRSRTKLARLDLTARGPITAIRATALLAGGLPEDIATRELDVVERILSPHRIQRQVLRPESHSPGNALIIEVQSGHLTEQFTAVGARGVRAEDVARAAAVEARTYLESSAAEQGISVGSHLADQLLLPLALAGGRFVTGPLTDHFTTNVDIIGAFLGSDLIRSEPLDGGFRVVCETPWLPA